MKAVLIFGGSIIDYDFIKAQITNDCYIICADSGYKHAINMGVKADLIIGDFDSLDILCDFSDKNVIRLPKRKNLTDSEAALLEARKKGFTDIVILGASGTRLDHTLSNILMLKNCLDNKENAVIINEYNKIYITESKITVSGNEGDFLSLVPLCDCLGVTTENLEYPLLGANLSVGKSHGISNIMLEKHAGISVEKGTLLVILSRD